MELHYEKWRLCGGNGHYQVSISVQYLYPCVIRGAMRVAAMSRTALGSLLILGPRLSRTRIQARGPQAAFLHLSSGRHWGAQARDTGCFRDKVSRGLDQTLRLPAMSLTSTADVVNEANTGVCAEVIPVPILSDNYAYLLIDPATGKTACVDPAEPQKVIAAAERRGVEITTLLCTHKHWDHSGGNVEMKRSIPELEVVSSAYEEDVPETTLALKHQDEYSLGSLTIRALHTPCHTRGHVLFYVTSPACSEGGPGRGRGAAPLVFSGDTLFVGGCGRFFEGDAEQMTHALLGVAAKLPAETRVFCGHEYTVSNLQFAAAVEPESVDVAEKLAWSRKILAAGGYTVPSTIAQELQHNPFMRVNEGSVRSVTGTKDGVDAMAKLREMKNGFRPPPQTPGRFPAL